MDFHEVRPEHFGYSNFYEFLKLPPAIELLPIYLGLFVIFCVLLYTFKSKVSWRIKLLSLYFSLSFFTNFAYQWNSLRPFDFIGIIVSLCILADTLLNKKIKIYQTEKRILLFSILLIMHLMLISGLGYLERYDNDIEVMVKKIIMICRLIVVVFIIIFYMNSIRTEQETEFIVTSFKYTGLSTLLIMLVQEFFFWGFGQSTVGLNIATGQIPVPRFASVSIEGGHFGRLIPTFLIYFIAEKRKFLKIGPIFLLSFIVSLTNISASFYGYLVFIMAAAIYCNLYFKRIKHGSSFLFLMLLVSIGIIYKFKEYAMLFINKIVNLLLVSNEYEVFTYRGIGVDFVKSTLDMFPLGIGFGVSERFLPDGSFTDIGIYALVTQISFLSIIAIVIFALFWISLFRKVKKYKKIIMEKKYAAHSFIMFLAIPFIFIFDIVWLYPGYILPLLILYTYVKGNFTKA